MLDHRQMKYFVTIVDFGSLSKAAEKLHIAQPALTKALQQLENSLGLTLIERSTRHFQVTEAGAIFYKRVMQILELIEATEAELADLKDGRSGVVRIGTIGSEMELMIPGLMAGFLEENAEVRFRCFEGNTPEVVENLKHGLIDVGIVRSPVVTEGFNALYLNSAPMVAATVVKKPFLKKKLLKWEDLKAESLIVHNRYVKSISDMCYTAGFEPKIGVTVEDTRSLLLMAEAGLGTAIVQKDWLKVADGSLHFREIEAPELETQTILLWQKERYTSELSRRFITYCMSALKTIK